MAGWGTPVESVEFGASVGATTFTFSPAATIPVGSFIYLGVAANVAATFTSCADNSTQAGTANSYTAGTLGSGSTLIALPVYCLATTRAILSTDVITVTIGSSGSRRNGRMLTWTPPGATPTVDVTVGAAAVTTSPLTFASSGTLTGTSELAIALGGYKSSAASGFADPTSGFTAVVPATGSGGTVTFIESDVSYNPNAGTAAVAPTHTYTLAPTSAVGRMIVFASVVTAQTKSGIHVVRRTWAG